MQRMVAPPRRLHEGEELTARSSLAPRAPMQLARDLDEALARIRHCHQLLHELILAALAVNLQQVDRRHVGCRQARLAEQRAECERGDRDPLEALTPHTRAGCGAPNLVGVLRTALEVIFIEGALGAKHLFDVGIHRADADHKGHVAAVGGDRPVDERHAARSARRVDWQLRDPILVQVPPVEEECLWAGLDADDSDALGPVQHHCRHADDADVAAEVDDCRAGWHILPDAISFPQLRTNLGIDLGKQITATDVERHVVLTPTACGDGRGSAHRPQQQEWRESLQRPRPQMGGQNLSCHMSIPSHHLSSFNPSISFSILQLHHLLPQLVRPEQLVQPEFQHIVRMCALPKARGRLCALPLRLLCWA
mmetsp:Transcript_20390/g.50147  ORF Transcript_20390/g.50147 Transcript_20390/m.50147 type:complete len:366 (-) Transcript_20390:78-1175(-)